MQTYFDAELAKLRKRIIKMLNLVNGQLDKSFRLLLDSDSDNIGLIKHDENKVDKLDIKIDKLCQQIFALGQPVAKDLRFIMASLKISNDIERIGDIAFDITKRSEAISQMPDIIDKYMIPEFLKKIRKLFNQVIESYTNSNSELAVDIISECRNSEEDCKIIFDKIVSEMTKKSDIIVVATDFILITRDFERILRHIENIAESIIFIVDSKIIKHPGAQAKS